MPKKVTVLNLPGAPGCFILILLEIHFAFFFLCLLCIVMMERRIIFRSCQSFVLNTLPRDQTPLSPFLFSFAGSLSRRVCFPVAALKTLKRSF